MANHENQQAFIAQLVDEWSDTVATRVLESLNKKRIGITDELRQSVKGQARANVGELLFKEYGRFRDMGAGSGWNKGIETRSGNRQRYLKQGRKPNKFYSKVAYGTLSGLIRDLTHTYMDNIVYTAKKNLE